MNRKILFLSILSILSLLSLVFPSLLFAQLDLEQEVLIIPEAHDAEPYKWAKNRNSRDYDVKMEYGKLIAGNDSEFKFSIKTKTPKAVNDVQVFITDKGLDFFQSRAS